ncbi:MAG: phosphoribosylformylglycinamidine synthase [Proteobacteria bacterium]|nr:phosphoribosylformylglycinamidine synthase [Pseudomonadota bacterium]
MILISHHQKQDQLELLITKTMSSPGKGESGESHIEKGLLTTLAIRDCFLVLSPPLDHQKKCHLKALLGVEKDSLKQRKEGSKTFSSMMVLPRKGLVSSWSVKATDILHHAGLKDIRQVEKGVLFFFDHTCDKDPIQAEVYLKKLADMYYDPMLEEVIVQSEGAYDHVFSHFSSQDKVHSRNSEPRIITPQMLLTTTKCDPTKVANLKNHLTTGPKDILNFTDVEIAMSQEVNSEHCRHHIFRSWWQIDSFDHQTSLMDLIKRTTEKSPRGILSAYKDNSAVIEGHQAMILGCDPSNFEYTMMPGASEIVLKVETHNHPTGVCPYPGAATGVGGEIRDEVATGRGGATKAGVCGYMVSHLHIKGYEQPWEALYRPYHQPAQSFLATPFNIMKEAPLGASRYGNEYGRALIAGFFRTLFVDLAESTDHGKPLLRGFHKPLMICGGLGSIQRSQVIKKHLQPGDLIIVLGGPGMKIGLGGGSLSSSVLASENPDGSPEDISAYFASVQRENPEMQRRAYHVIESCFQMGDNNPIISIHDVGAGGLANAVPELAHDSAVGAEINLEQIPVADHTMTPLEIWCNESQERYVLGLSDCDLDTFDLIAKRERAPYAVIGRAVPQPHLTVENQSGNKVVDIDLDALFSYDRQIIQGSRLISVQEDKVSTMTKDALIPDLVNISEMLSRVLQMPCVSDKSFLITIADRSVGGLTVLEPMVGPWQVPVADAGVTLTSYEGICGEVIAMGERPLVALKSPDIAARTVASEAIMNALCADIEKLEDIRFSANWQVDFSHQPDQIHLWQAVKSLSDFCVSLGISVPVGKDSMSMGVEFKEPTIKPQGQGLNDGSYRVSAPMTLVITAVAPVKNVTSTLTPCLTQKTSHLVWVHLSEDEPSLGCSVLETAYNSPVQSPSDIAPNKMKNYFHILRQLKDQQWVYAYHDVSDGGLVTCVLEMAFASQKSLEISLNKVPYDPVLSLFGEGIGAVLQIDSIHLNEVTELFEQSNIPCFPVSQVTATPANEDKKEAYYFRVTHQHRTLLDEDLFVLKKQWSSLSYHMKKHRDHPDTALSEWQHITSPHRGLFFSDTHIKPKQQATSARVAITDDKPKVAILREQGINGHREMAYAFLDAGFQVYDLHMSECLSGDRQLSDFVGLVIPGGFSYGDVLGAGRGWASVIKHNEVLRRSFRQFFQNKKTFSFGVCNGCQMLSELRDWIDGGHLWPEFSLNHSRQFESRTVMVEITPSPSIMLQQMVGMQLPVVIAHAEGRAHYRTSVNPSDRDAVVAVRYINEQAHPTEVYPLNPSGSVGGITGVSSLDGRVTLMMPHPERNYLVATSGFRHGYQGKYSPWHHMFCATKNWLETVYSEC